MTELPPDPFRYDWPNTCRNCGQAALVDKRGYCSRVCECEDVLSALFELEVV